MSRGKRMNKKIVAIFIVNLFIGLSITPIIYANNINKTTNDFINKK